MIHPSVERTARAARVERTARSGGGDRRVDRLGAAPGRPRAPLAPRAVVTGAAIFISRVAARSRRAVASRRRARDGAAGGLHCTLRTRYVA